jgi:hypothetical protein
MEARETRQQRPVFMRLLIIALFLLTTGGERVFGEVAAPVRATAGPSPASQEATHRSAVESCVQMWDRGTHMTKQQWMRTCKRVQNRLQQLTN